MFLSHFFVGIDRLCCCSRQGKLNFFSLRVVASELDAIATAVAASVLAEVTSTSKCDDVTENLTSPNCLSDMQSPGPGK